MELNIIMSEPTMKDLMNIMESMLISIDKSMKSMEDRLEESMKDMEDRLTRMVKIETEETHRKIELLAENVTKTSNYELEKRVEWIEEKLEKLGA